jgi:FG-GAP-like repeat
VANSEHNGYVSILLGNGDGTFQAAAYYAAGRYAESVAVGDFNGDGKLDLAVANNEFNGYVSILLGNGDGTFQAPAHYAAGSNANSVAMGDFNGDGKADLAVTDGSTNSGSVEILLGNGDGTFQAPATYTAGNYPISVAVGDFDGDGRPDLAMANYADAGSVTILLGNGDGTFQAPATYATGRYATSVAIGDLNGDGKPDLAVTDGSPSSGSVAILLGNGDGTFSAAR